MNYFSAAVEKEGHIVVMVALTGCLLGCGRLSPISSEGAFRTSGTTTNQANISVFCQLLLSLLLPSVPAWTSRVTISLQVSARTCFMHKGAWWASFAKNTQIMPGRELSFERYSSESRQPHHKVPAACVYVLACGSVGLYVYGAFVRGSVRATE
jgi:hypothetical protein